MNSSAGSVPVPADVLRTVAHDLRQPLSGIETVAYYLSLVLPRTDEKVQAQLEEIRRLVEQASLILNRGVKLVAGAGGALDSELLPGIEEDAKDDSTTLGDQLRLMLP